MEQRVSRADASSPPSAQWPLRATLSPLPSRGRFCGLVRRPLGMWGRFEQSRRRQAEGVIKAKVAILVGMIPPPPVPRSEHRLAPYILGNSF
ncbi:hypothetical protein EVAR_60087_1 [Eumeta japonica]|uniref:Uncharacterized protein n=1 Tax=Eumeta variegata TaxID=151549 RepID=A0A4C1YLA9_EUMVA|nr:hypothetical protein EVAR_60087_1 [Eumeta japonica]